MKGLALITTLLVIINIVNLISESDAQEQVVADVVAPTGTIRGSFMKSRRGTRFFAARGIRFAKPPTGELRFQPPVPVDDSEAIFDATQEGPSCPQPGGRQPSEDCLRLNVYTTKVPQSNETDSDVKSPVLVFFHPGGFYSSSGQSAIYGPQFFMDKDIVLVTVNYRLATLGFLSTGDSLAPGNLGLKDQVIALRWIQKNIGAFGGDAGNVTISGYSAGSHSVSLHLVSPMSKGLFHKAIAMSGSVVGQSPVPHDQLALAKKHATIFRCPTNNTSEMIACMKTIPVENYINTTDDLFEWRFNPILLWSPVVEPEVEGVERFLTDQPENLIRQGKFHQVPVIVGQTRDEFAGNVVYWVEQSEKGDNSLFDDLKTRWDELAPIVFSYERETPRSRNISNQLRQYYFKGQPISRNTVDGVAGLYKDSIIGYPSFRLAKLLSNASTEPVYHYEFTYQGRSWPSEHALLRQYNMEVTGVAHHDDLLYLFYVSVRFPYFNVTDPEFQTVERMTTMWTNFAHTGNPIPIADVNFENVEWEPRTPANKKYLKIDNTLTMHTDLNAKDMAFWDSLFDPQSSTIV